MKMRPSKIKILIWKFILITHACIIPSPKSQMEFFGAQMSLRVLKLLRVLSDRVLCRVLSDRFLFRIVGNRVHFRVLSDRDLFRFLSDRVLFRFLCDRVLYRVLMDSDLFKSSWISSPYSSVIDSSLESPVLFVKYPAIFFYQNVQPLFYLKQLSCFKLYRQKYVHLLLAISLTVF